MKRDEAIVKLRTARRELFDALSGMTEEDILRPNAVDKWSVKDLLGHIAAWDEETLRVVQAFIMQANPIYSYTISDRNEFATWNAEQAALRKDDSLEQIRKEIENARRDLIQVVEGVTDQVLLRTKVTPWGKTRSGLELLDDAAAHDLEHSRDIRSFRKKRERWARARHKYTTRRREGKKKTDSKEEDK